MEVNELYGATEKAWFSCSKNLTTIAQLISQIIQKYSDYVEKRGIDITWNSEYTFAIRETIEDCLKKQKEQEDPNK